MSEATRPVAAQDTALTLLRQLFQASGAINAQLRVVLTQFELTESMTGVLWMLDPDQPPVRMREIAHALGCDPSNVTLIGDKLHRAGLVVRQAHPGDRRSRTLALTDAGLDVRARLLSALVAATPMSTLTTREQHQLSHTLLKLGANP